MDHTLGLFTNRRWFDVYKIWYILLIYLMAKQSCWKPQRDVYAALDFKLAINQDSNLLSICPESVLFLWLILPSDLFLMCCAFILLQIFGNSSKHEYKPLFLVKDKIKYF